MFLYIIIYLFEYWINQYSNFYLFIFQTANITSNYLVRKIWNIYSYFITVLCSVKEVIDVYAQCFFAQEQKQINSLSKKKC